jgi:hypothetical protein
MDAAIAQFYEKRINSRKDVDSEYGSILDAIARVSAQLKAPLRQDAIYFLANNLADMIVYPMWAAHDLPPTQLPTARPVDRDTLSSFVEHDLALIIGSSLLAANERDRSAISAASVIIGLSLVIDQLNFNSTKLWGR